MNLRIFLTLFTLLLSLQVTTVNSEPATLDLNPNLNIEQSQLDHWWRYMTPIEKRNYMRRLKQGNRIQTLTRDEFYEVENKRLLEWVNYRLTLDGGL